MRFLYLTDTHCRQIAPFNRKDDYATALKFKLEEVASLALKLGVTAIFHGGDLWDTPDLSIQEADFFISCLKKTGIPIYIIAGNHDLYNKKLDTLPHTLLGVQDKLGVLKVIKTGERLYFDDGNVRVQLTGQSYHSQIDLRDPRLDYCVRKKNCDYAIHMVHGMLMAEEKFPGAVHTHLSEVHDTEADLTLAGHMHFGFPDYEYQGKYFINIGAIARLINHVAEINRPVQVLLIDLSRGKSELHKIRLKSALPGNQVLDSQKAEETASQVKWLADYICSAQKRREFQTRDLKQIVEIIGNKEGITKEIRMEALRYAHATSLSKSELED